ncbi:DUF4097 family beta strand repeat-containing protein [Kocuria sp. cx-455]|uniref:DUF4097 family beta strand repeat-containing protein n=1 Tax=Kocuria sp. cx-455 TaxID=2771377 RepID=UPI003D70C568
MSTHFPPSQSDGAPHGSPEPSPDQARQSVPAAGPHPANPPISRGQRRGWNTATGIIGGLCALSLLVGGAGAAAAAVMTQERSDTWTASSDASRIEVDAQSANVHVVTSPTAEHVEVEWQEIGWGLDDQRSPREADGVIRVAAPEQSSRWNGGINNIRITVPEDDSLASLDLTATHGIVDISGAFDRVDLSSEYGSLSGRSVKAKELAARTVNGQVLLDGVEVSDRLDAHTRHGLTSVRVSGTAPKQTSVTAENGIYELKLPTADYWYPATSQQSFADPRSPETVTPERNRYNGSFDSSFGDYDAAPSSSVSPSATAGGSPSASPSAEASSTPGAAPSNSARDRSGFVTAWSSQEACASAPGDRPCLFVAGEPVGSQDSADMRYWREQWNSAYDDAMTNDPWNDVDK